MLMLILLLILMFVAGKWSIYNMCTEIQEQTILSSTDMHSKVMDAHMYITCRHVFNPPCSTVLEARAKYVWQRKREEEREGEVSNPRPHNIHNVLLQSVGPTGRGAVGLPMEGRG
jgi:hypothetical protein